MKITEIFFSIQGESTRAGMPCVFIRTTGCNLRCVWCDSDYAFYDGRQISIDDIVRQVETYHCNLIEITGGEPLLQRDISELCQVLLSKGCTVLLETSGASDISGVPQGVITIMDIKCPGSDESDKNFWPNIDHLTARDEVKFVIADRRDYEWTKDIIQKYDLSRRVAVLLSVVFDQLSLREIAEWILEDRLPVRLQTQLHKHIWGPGVKGV